MKKLLAKYWAGWMNPANMSADWLQAWKMAALDAEHSEEQLVVFRIPMDSEGVIEEIEKLLQDKFGAKDAENNER